MNRASLQPPAGTAFLPRTGSHPHRVGRLSDYKRWHRCNCVGPQCYRHFPKRNGGATEQSDKWIGGKLSRKRPVIRHRSCHYAERQEGISARVSAGALRPVFIDCSSQPLEARRGNLMVTRSAECQWKVVGLILAYPVLTRRKLPPLKTKR
jgi:hypothetical protein